MPLTIGSNIASIAAQRQLGRATDTVANSYERLSSGQRINRASDDAAGLAISSTLNARSRVYTQALRNVNDGVSYLNVAEEALNSLSSIVTRQLELAEQGANGTYSIKQRLAMDKEAYALTQEYNRIVESTKFNGIGVLTNSGTPLVIQQGFQTQDQTQLAVGQKMGPPAGSGNFSNENTLFTATVLGIGLYTLETSDVNNDGALDIIGQSSTGLGIFYTLLNDGNNAFSAISSSAATGTSVIATADYNQDGNIDVAGFDTNSGNFVVSLGNGDGTFRGPSSYAGRGTAGFSHRIIAADLNGDGASDVLEIAGGGNKVTIMINDGGGQFTSQSVALPSGASDLSIGDLNGDGLTDFVTVDGTNLQPYLNRGSGTFSTGEILSSPAFQGMSRVELADLNNDGAMDYVGAGSTNIRIGYGKGDGTFSAQLSCGSLAPEVYEITVGDYNGDQYLDVMTEDLSLSSTATVFLSNGGSNGSFTSGTTFARGHAAGLSSNSVDLNQDGVTDMLYHDNSSGTGQVKFRYGVADASGRANPFQSDVNLLSGTGAKQALKTLNSNLQRLTQEMGNIGSFQSRLNVSQGIIRVTRENYLNAESRIKDIDVASESSNLIRSQILQQTATAVLQQANLSPNLVLRLLTP